MTALSAFSLGHYEHVQLAQISVSESALFVFTWSCFTFMGPFSFPSFKKELFSASFLCKSHTLSQCKKVMSYDQNFHF